MAKLKTDKAIAKRLLIKKSKSGIKIMKRHDGQDHFNGKQTGKTRRRKRRDNILTTTLQKTITRAMPYNI